MELRIFQASRLAGPRSVADTSPSISFFPSNNKLLSLATSICRTNFQTISSQIPSYRRQIFVVMKRSLCSTPSLIPSIFMWEGLQASQLSQHSPSVSMTSSKSDSKTIAALPCPPLILRTSIRLLRVQFLMSPLPLRHKIILARNSRPTSVQILMKIKLPEAGFCWITLI